MRKASVLALVLLCSGLAWAADVNSDFGLEEAQNPQQPYISGSPKAFSWVDRVTLNTAVSRPAAAAVNGKVYCIGGQSSTSPVHLGVTTEYDPIADTWTARDTMPVPASNITCAVWNNKIYVPGGYTDGSVYLNNLQVFDPASGTWTQETAMPAAISGTACAVVGDTLYVIGGTTGSYLTSVYAYDLVAQTWSTKASMTYARAYFGAGVVNGKIYAVGGYNAGDQAYNEEYDPAANTWTTKTAVPTARGGVGVTAFGGKVYAVGGGWSAYYSTIDVYDPATDTWSTETPMLHGCRTIGVASMGNDIYVVGGWAGGFLNYNQLGGQAPMAVWSQPADGLSGAHVNPEVKIAFSEPIAQASFGYACNPSLGAVHGLFWNAAGDTLTIDLVNNKAYSTTYALDYWATDLSGLNLGSGPVSNPMTFGTWDAPEVIYSQMDAPGSSYVSQIFGDYPTYSSYLSDDINLAGMDSVVVTAVELVGGAWNGHSWHPMDSLYLGLTTDSTDLPAWSQAIWQGNLQPGSYDDVQHGNGTNNTFIMYLDQPVTLHNGKSWLVSAPYMSFAAKDGQWGWAQNDPAVVYGTAPAWRNPENGFAYGADWQRASVLGMAGDGVFRVLGRTYPTPHTFGTIDTSITVTGPGDYTLAGITFCSADSNYYFVSMNDDYVYRLDPDDWSYAQAFPVDNGANEIPWGISWDGTHFWVGQVQSSMAYVYDKQYTFAGTYTGIYYNATGIGGASWMGGMDFDGTHTWQLAVSGSNKLYKLDLPGGTLVDSIPYVFWGGTSQRGCSWIPWTSQFLSGGWNSNQLYLMDTLGNMVNSASMSSMADVDIYDFVNEGHELWGLVTINTSPNTIHKVWLGITRPTGVEGGPSTPLGDRILSLMPNFPNPVRGRTNISFNLPRAGTYELRVYNIAGQMVDRLGGMGQAGPNRLSWNAGRLAAGVYLYSVSSNGQSATRKLVVIR